MSSSETTAAIRASTEPEKTSQSRLASLDAFRGLTMILMVLVNSAGSDHVYTQLEHAPWHGLTLADLIFPSFVWIVGITTVFSLSSKMGTTPRPQLMRLVFMRALKLYALGLLSYLAPQFNLATLRLSGVLQRIAICYLVGSLLYLFTSRRTQMIWIAGLLVGYWALMTLTPAPGFQPGDLSIEGNLAHYVDRAVLGAHNYAQTKTWDPEGILSTLPAIASVLLGILAGCELRAQKPLGSKLKLLALAGCGLLVAGLIVNHWFPINKKLWTSSFVLVCAGVDCLVLPLIAYCIDIRNYRRYFSPFIVMGMNAITIYMLSELLDLVLSQVHLQSGISLKALVFQTCFQPLASPEMASFLYAAAYTLLMYGVARVLYARKIFLRI